MKIEWNKKSIFLVGIIVVVLLTILLVLYNKISNEDKATKTESSLSTGENKNTESNKSLKENVTESTAQNDNTTNAVEVTEDTIDETTKSEINKLVEDYYISIPSSDSVDKKKGIEAYKDIKSYIRAGLIQDSYIVFSTYRMKFENIDTLAPGMSVLYLTKNDTSFVINKDTDNEELNQYIENYLKEDEIKKIADQVNTEFKEAMKKDTKLESFINKVENAK